MTLPHRESDDWIAGQSRLARRRWMRAAIAGIVGTAAAGAIVAPAVPRRRERWVPAGCLDDLPTRRRSKSAPRCRRSAVS